MNTISPRLTAALCAVALNSTVSMSAAQSAPQQNTAIETITVLGARTSENANLGGVSLKDLPLNAHVVGQTEIERIQFVDPDELLDRIPGETQVRNLRIPNGGKSYTLAFVDGVPIESPYEGATQRLDRVNTFDIQRVEVIKAQASALYPNNVFGGVVNVVTRDTPKQAQAIVSAETGNFGRQRLAMNIGSTIGKLGYSLNANNRRLDGLRIGSQNDRDAGSVKLDYQFNKDTRISARLEQLKETVETRGDLSAEQIEEDRRQAGGLNSATDLEQRTASLSVRHAISNGEFSAVLLQRQKDTIGLSRFRGPQDENDDAVNVNAQYRHSLNSSSLIVGIDTYSGDVETKSFNRNDIDLSGSFSEFSTQLDIDAYFAQYQFELLNDLTVTAGLRYENITLRSNIDDQSSAEFNDLAPKLGINYQLSDKTQLWVSISDGFYVPDLDDLFDPDNGNSDLKPEEAQNIEFGFRGVAGNWAYDTSVYHNEIVNYLVTQEFVDSNGNDFELTTNSGQVTVKGVETVIEYAPSSAPWRAAVTHTYADNRYDSFVQSVAGANDDFSGNQLGRSPKHHLNARLAWEPIDNFTAEVEGDFYSSYFSDDANSEAGRFTRDERINLRFSYELERWRLWFNVLNVSDTLEDRATFRRGQLQFRTVDGRSYFAGMSYKF